MQINPITSSPFQAAQGNSPFAKLKQTFDKLGSALDSGNLSDAKEALAQLEKNAPAQAGKANNPLGAKIETLSKAVESGDLKTAQDAYTDMKKTMSQGPRGVGGGAGAGSPPPGGAPPSGANKSASADGTSSSNKTYDKKDADKDGTVSWKEEQDYSLKHPEEAEKSTRTSATATTAKIDSDRGQIDATA